MTNAIITGWGSHVPRRVLTNADLERMVDTSDEWITTRTGIRERRLAEPGETPVSMGLEASRAALARAGVKAEDLDLVIFATTTPDYILPASGCLLQQKLGATRAGAFDVNAACSGFVYGLSIASQFVRSGACQRVLLVTSEALSRYVNWGDRSTCVLFGDGAAAIVLEASSQPAGLLSSVLGSRGDVGKLLVIEAGGSARPCTPETLAANDHLIRMHGNEIFKLAVRTMTQATRDALQKAGLGLDGIKKIIPHQANLRILTATQEALGAPLEKMFVNVDRYGNTAAASIPIALCEYLAHNEVHAGDHLLFVAFGGGLTWGAAVVRWAEL